MRIRTGYRHDAADWSSAIAASVPLPPPPTIATTGPLAASWRFSSCTVPVYTTNSIGYMDNTGTARDQPSRIRRHRIVVRGLRPASGGRPFSTIPGHRQGPPANRALPLRGPQRWPIDAVRPGGGNNNDGPSMRLEQHLWATVA